MSSTSVAPCIRHFLTKRTKNEREIVFFSPCVKDIRCTHYIRIHIRLISLSADEGAEEVPAGPEKAAGYDDIYENVLNIHIENSVR